VWGRYATAKFTRLAAFVAVGVGTALSACRTVGEQAQVWVFDPSSTVTPPTAESLVGQSSRQVPRVRLTGAINETLSFSFAVRAGKEAIPRLDLRVAPLTSVQGKIDPSVVTLYRMHGVEVGEFPGWHIRSIPPRMRDRKPLDALVPVRASRGGLPATLSAGDTYVFWVDVAIPKGTFEGMYATNIELLSGGAVVGSVDVGLTVWPIVLPDESDVAVLAEVDHLALFQHHIRFDTSAPPPSVDDWSDHSRRSEMDALLLSTLRMLQGHRLTPVLPGLSPTRKVNAAGGLAVDWGPYDAVVEPLLSGRAFFNRVPLRLWPMPIERLFSPQSADRSRLAPGSIAMLDQYLTQCASHFEQNGWLDRCYALAPEASSEAVRRFAGSVHAANGRVAVASRGFPQDMRPYGWPDFPYTDLSDAVDVWMPPAQFYDVEAMAQERKKGRRTWLAADRPPFSGSTSIHAPSTYTRVLPWQAEELGAQALSIGRVNSWPDVPGLTSRPNSHGSWGFRRPAPDDCARFDPHVLLYPGRAFGLDEPVESVRLKHLRRGLQDAAYFRLLREHGLGHVVTALRESLAAYAGSDAYRTHFADGRSIGWADDPELYDAARDIMAEELIRAASSKDAADRSQPFGRTAAWRRFMLATRKVEVHADGVRGRLIGTPAAREVELETILTIVNRERAPISGEVRFGPLPEGWSARSGERVVSAIAPGSAKRVTLGIRTSHVPVGEGGILGLPIVFATDDGEVHRRTVRAASLTALSTESAIRIDGDLSDWPPGSVNVAADFRLIAGSREDGEDDLSSRPTEKTFGFVLRDHDYLYVAINCGSDKWAGTPSSRRKGVRYDDLIPVEDEDLVEVLIDPLNGGTRSPGDLYHIVVKRSGNDLTEKGIGFDPPCGPRAPWAVDIEVATAASAQRWTAELRVPLKDISPDGYTQTVWGFNLTRWDASRQEFSTWSGAVGNAYDPLSLGNLFLP
jgi:hypothetical protein